jgi:hypothetical protein
LGPNIVFNGYTYGVSIRESEESTVCASSSNGVATMDSTTTNVTIDELR